MKNILKYIFVSLFLYPLAGLAHVKWFVPENSSPVRNYSLSDAPVIIWILVSILIIFIGIILEKIWRLPKGLENFLKFLERPVLSLFGILIGLAFVAFSLSGFIFAPVLKTEGMFGSFLLVIQAVIGISFIIGAFEKIAALIILGSYFAAIPLFGFLNMLEALEIIGIALAILIAGRPRWRIINFKNLEKLGGRFYSYAAPILRVFTGLNLIILGFTEKILRPDLGLAFLQTHPWNFMQMLGFHQFSDYWFVLSAGAVEVIFGLIFVLGIVTRLNALVLAGFFIATLILLGPMELLGHAPHFAIVFVLLVFGSGEKLKFFSIKQPISRRAFLF
ncbi:MAG: hypothetical protein AAB793_02460 [Patescibacteria group bacterium]